MILLIVTISWSIYVMFLGVFIMTGSYWLWSDALFILVSVVILKQAESTYLGTKVRKLFVQNYS